MRRTARAGLTVLITAAAAACATAPRTEIGAAPSGSFELDPNHASVVWRVEHAGGLSRYVARFDRFDAALEFDPDNPAASRVEATLDPTSVNTGNADFDAEIAANRSLLNARAHPEIRFVSTNVEMTSQTTALVTGDLGFRGVTMPVTLETTFNGSAYDPLRFGQVIGFSAIARFERSDFGADAYVNFGVGDTVEVLIEAEFVRRGRANTP